jgi:ABC-type sugar transport system ATPase subunit
LPPPPRSSQLSLAQRHLIEIARALSQQARVVILDEPTAALSQQEIREFYGLVRGLKAQGVAVLFITHKFDEMFAVCDRYVVLRDGASVGAAASPMPTSRRCAPDGRPRHRAGLPAHRDTHPARW